MSNITLQATNIIKGKTSFVDVTKSIQDYQREDLVSVFWSSPTGHFHLRDFIVNG